MDIFKKSFFIQVGTKRFTCLRNYGNILSNKVICQFNEKTDEFFFEYVKYSKRPFLIFLFNGSYRKIEVVVKLGSEHSQNIIIFVNNMDITIGQRFYLSILSLDLLDCMAKSKCEISIPFFAYPKV